MLSLIKRLATGLLLVLIAVHSNSILIAAEQVAPEQKRELITPGDARKGRYVFRKCIACHQNNDVPIVCPHDKTKQEWYNHFNKGFRKCKQVSTENNFVKYQFTNIQLNHLLGFLYKYEKNSGEKFTMCK